MPVQHVPAGSPQGGQFQPGGSGKQHHAKAPAKTTAAPTFAQLQQWLKDEKAGKKLTAEQKAALHAAHEAHLAHEAKLAAGAKAKPASGAKTSTAKSAHGGALDTALGDEEFTELVGYRGKRADLVGAPASGVPRFLVMKADASAGLLEPEFVRELIAKTSTEEAPVPETAEAGERVLDNGIVLKGSAAAMAAFIHAASVRDEANGVAKTKNDAASRKHDAATGAAMSDGSYPIENEADLDKAIHAVGRGGASHNAIRKHIITRARSLGASSKIPDNWNADGSLKSGVSKEAGMPDTVVKDGLDLDAATPDEDDLDDGADVLDPTVPFAAPGNLGDLPGDPTDPGSPAWEAIDAATAQKWLGILARAKNAIGLLSDREAIEAATADPDDIGSAYGLQDAACALDDVIGQLAVFAAGEQAEADLAAEAMEAVGKAVAGAEAPLGVIEVLAPVLKAGRVLSASNEAKLRSAAQAIGEVLSSLPQAPEGVAKVKEAPVPAVKTRAAQVAKETASPEAQAADTGPVNAGGTTGLGEPRETGPAAALPADGPQAPRPGDVPGRTVVKSADGLKALVWDQHRRPHMVSRDRIGTVLKADGDAEGKTTMQAVFDENGNLVGIVDPADITPVAGAGGGSGDDGDDDSDAAAPAPAADDMQPQPPADAGTPSEDVAKTAGDPVNAVPLTQDVLKSVAEQAAKTALESVEAAHQQVVAKMAADKAEQAKEIEVLKSRLETVEAQPAMPKVFTSGQVPPAHTLRGQDQGAGAQVDVAKARERKAELYAATGPDQARIAKEMNEQAADYYAAMRAGR